MSDLTPKQAYEGLIKIEPRYRDRLIQLAECVVLRGASKEELWDNFYSTEGGQDVLTVLREHGLELEFRQVFAAALDYVIDDMRNKQAKAGLN
jgi:hypothetical protein